MAEARCLPTLKYVSILLNPIPQYMGQMPSSDYCDMIIQAWASAIPNMMALENANARDFDDAVKVEIIKGKMAGKYAPVPPQNNFVNPAVNIDRTLKTHLSGDRELYSWMRNENIADQNSDQVQQKKKSLAKQNDSIILQSIVSQPVFPSYDEMQKSFQAMLKKQKAESKAEIEKLKTEFKSKISQQSKKSHLPRDPIWSNLSREEALQWLDKAFPLPIANDNEDEEGGYNKEENKWHAPS
ncbi:6676_t:CDS:2 [Cetraspora pellucida]|uniref:6676_t:CDS:1 n=1 Tax=Cetraspora pellucida TaxID=1433469 RepID=A0A9N9JE20_9GLOM|nr:6676_t:CDS:2 [Cetraspora pellucida]